MYGLQNCTHTHIQPATIYIYIYSTYPQKAVVTLVCQALLGLFSLISIVSVDDRYTQTQFFSK